MFAHAILTWGDGTRYGFAARRPLAARRRLLLTDRRVTAAAPIPPTATKRRTPAT
ncbi:hypothetical protein OG863_13495 [Streptomyces decoyicus]|uniref:Uncharacterized protein n=1 Tax=Streptomyces decoyicus TaxID=249567 RepID=A0ABZ1FFD5_9ACTN|nr:hypothetical protein [Streptomyces decoyicus]WSB68886.1 hypothetical protein OG863_13495 [Streptomyces decoyicus]